MPTIKQIVTEYLKQNGYDGLCNSFDCGCRLDDLFPCTEPSEECVAGYKGPDPSGETDWLIYSTKEAAEKATEGEDNE